ncbi:MAG: glycine zipper 2TM domain-containing protein [Proteobacteria bacterium]|nr:glycine zipper 2TM domain-containing protein [Pseudomonadota bacterium]MBU1547021.1 glycine zipper 2TM domain-containing protein [Pseudomonadota bacterium]MBU2620374.1 glycine zipper 2TM domain-containing protein [Pseudomonadota bacterium]
MVGTQTAGCVATTPSAERGGLFGAGSGAAIGAIAGQLIGGNTKATLIGAAIGAVVGGLVGSYIDQQNATRAEAAKKYQYDEKVAKLEVESASATPDRVAPGSAIDSSVQYTTLSPNKEQQVAITERRVLVGEQESFDLSERKVMREQGTHTSTAKVNLPKDLPKGNYTLVTTITDGQITKTSKTPFAVG